MGVTYVEGRVTGPTGRGERIRFLVDSGVQYSLLPLDVWRRIGLIEKRKQRFTLGDGRTRGMVTLEILGVVRDPFRRTIEPMHAPLMRVA